MQVQLPAALQLAAPMAAPQVHVSLTEQELSVFRTKSCKFPNASKCGGASECSHHHAVHGPHSWTRRCPFYLRIKSSLKYLPFLCPKIQVSGGDASQGGPQLEPSRCDMQNFCPYSHSEEEVVYHPLRYKTRLCDAFRLGVPCHKRYCPDAHGQGELRTEAVSRMAFILPFCKPEEIYCPFPQVRVQESPALSGPADADAPLTHPAAATGPARRPSVVGAALSVAPAPLPVAPQQLGPQNPLAAVDTAQLVSALITRLAALPQPLQGHAAQGHAAQGHAHLQAAAPSLPPHAASTPLRSLMPSVSSYAPANTAYHGDFSLSPPHSPWPPAHPNTHQHPAFPQAALSGAPSRPPLAPRPADPQPAPLTTVSIDMSQLGSPEERRLLLDLLAKCSLNATSGGGPNNNAPLAHTGPSPRWPNAVGTPGSANSLASGPATPPSHGSSPLGCPAGHASHQLTGCTAACTALPSRSASPLGLSPDTSRSNSPALAPPCPAPLSGPCESSAAPPGLGSSDALWDTQPAMPPLAPPGFESLSFDAIVRQSALFESNAARSSRGLGDCPGLVGGGMFGGDTPVGEGKASKQGGRHGYFVAPQDLYFPLPPLPFMDPPPAPSAHGSMGGMPHCGSSGAFGMPGLPDQRAHDAPCFPANGVRLARTVAPLAPQGQGAPAGLPTGAGIPLNFRSRQQGNRQQQGQGRM